MKEKNFIVTITILLMIIVHAQGRCRINDCDKCDRNGGCTSCKNTFCLQSSSSCPSCGSVIANCAVCSSCSKCTKCINNYVVNGSSKCQLCSVTLPRCATCSSTTTCTTCIAPYVLVGNTCCSVMMPFCTGCLIAPTTCDACISTSYCKKTTTAC